MIEARYHKTAHPTENSAAYMNETNQ